MTDRTEALFAVGEVVALKSGSPPMTVIAPTYKVPLGTWVGCMWFVDGKAEHGAFPPDALGRHERSRPVRGGVRA